MKRLIKNSRFIGALSLITLLAGVCYSSDSHADLAHSDAVVKLSEFNVDEPATLWLGFKVHDGFKWNKDFPSKVIFLTKPTLIKLETASFENSDFYVDKNLVLIPVMMTPLKRGYEDLKVALRFSVCDAVACHIESVRFDISVMINE